MTNGPIIPNEFPKLSAVPYKTPIVSGAAHIARIVLMRRCFGFLNIWENMDVTNGARQQRTKGNIGTLEQYKIIEAKQKENDKKRREEEKRVRYLMWKKKMTCFVLWHWHRRCPSPCYIPYRNINTILSHTTIHALNERLITVEWKGKANITYRSMTMHLHAC